VINDDLQACIDCVNDIISNERKHQKEQNADHRISANIEFINNMRKELLSFSKGEQ
jgi:guanylate kinase